jgi:hypothetical protein
MAAKIQIKHITNSLYQMERWSRHLRMAMLQMDPNMLVSTDDELVPDPGGTKLRPPPILAMGCPPPPHEPDCCCPECCHPDGHHHHHHHGHDDDDKGKTKGKGTGAGKGKGKKKAARK